MTAARVSVIIVSRGRPDALRLCLTGVRQIAYPNFEVIVVADPAGVAVAQAMDWVKVVPWDEANISTARNAGLAQAGGDIVAFIDDDAVPEPTWLTKLTAPFTAAEVMVAGGFVLGRNGISYQWRARRVFADGCTEDVAVSEVSVLEGSLGNAVKTEGTNMAFRRDKLCQMGGFDPAFAFYLDETDVNMRLAAEGVKTAIVPDALVHHGFAASARRTPARVPTDLFEIAASQAVFLRKHGPERDLVAARVAFMAAQRRRLLTHMVGGGLEPRDVRRIMATCDAGWDAGLTRVFGRTEPIAAADDFRPVAALPERPHVNLGARVWNVKAQRAKARAAVAGGARVTLYYFWPSVRYHRVRMHPDGYWEQCGGLFGKSDRTGPQIQFVPYSKRISCEIDRVVTVRQPESNN